MTSAELYANADRPGLALALIEATRDPRTKLAVKVKRVVLARATLKTPEGRIINEPSIVIAPGVELSVEGRARGKGTGIAIVRVNDSIVLHQFAGTYEPGNWETVVASAAASVQAEAAAAASREAMKEMADGTLTIRRAA